MEAIIDECNTMADKNSEKKLSQPLDPERYGIITRKDMDCIFEQFDGELSTTEDAGMNTEEEAAALLNMSESE